MKIVSVQFLSYRLGPTEPFWNSIIRFSSKGFGFVKVETDDGAVGYGLATSADARFESPIAARIVGEDPMNYARLWQRMFTGWRKPVAKGEAISAIGAVDIALWDLRGHLVGQPVYQLLGGFRNRVPVYAAGGYYADGKSSDDLVAEMLSYVAAGYRSVKMKVGGAPFAEDVARVHTVREGIGDSVGLMIDANNAWTAVEALRFFRAVEDCNLTWFEEPCWPDDLEGARKLREALDVPVASGEIEFTRWGCRDLIDRGGADIVQADPWTCGGLTEWVRIAAYASAHHLTMAPHGQDYLGAHAVAAVDNGLIVESYARSRPWQDAFVAEFELDDGEIVLPSTPGLGLKIDFDALERASQ